MLNVTSTLASTLKESEDPRIQEISAVLSKTNWHNYFSKQAIQKWTSGGDYVGPSVEVSHLSLNPMSKILSASVSIGDKSALISFNLSAETIYARWEAGARRGARSGTIKSRDTVGVVKDLMVDLLRNRG